MTQKFFIQHGERMLIDCDYGAIGFEGITVDGPMSLETAKEAFEAYDNAVAAYRINLAEPNIENVTEDVLIQPDPFADAEDEADACEWASHVRSCKSPSIYI